MGGAIPLIGAAIGLIGSSQQAHAQQQAVSSAASQQAAAQRQAAQLQAKAQENALKWQKQQYYQNRADWLPWQKAGLFALAHLFSYPEFHFDNSYPYMSGGKINYSFNYREGTPTYGYNPDGTINTTPSDKPQTIRPNPNPSNVMFKGNNNQTQQQPQLRNIAYRDYWQKELAPKLSGNQRINNPLTEAQQVFNGTFNINQVKDKYGNLYNWYNQNKNQFYSPYGLNQNQYKQLYDLATAVPLNQLAKRNDLIGKGAYALALDLFGNNAYTNNSNYDFSTSNQQNVNNQNNTPSGIDNSALNTLNQYLSQMGSYQGSGQGNYSLAGYIDPSYAWRFNEGVNALDKSASARGMLLSGAQARALTRYGQDMATQEYQNAFNRALREYMTNLGRWQSMAGYGTSSTAALTSAGNNMANSMANILMQGANAQARYGAGAGNALAQGTLASGQVGANQWGHIAGVINNALGNYMLSNMLNGGGNTGVSYPVSNYSIGGIGQNALYGSLPSYENSYTNTLSGAFA